MTERLLENLVDYVISLCESSTLSEERKQLCIDWAEEVLEENTINEFKFQELSLTADFLKDNQIDRIASGFNYNQTDIINKLKKEIWD